MEPLTGESEQRKRPMLLYIIIAVLLIVVIVLSIILAVNSGKNEDSTEGQKQDNAPINPIKNDHIIPVNDSFYSNDTEFGAYQYHGKGNHLDSEYYKILDVYNMESNSHRSILTHFKTYQQTSEYSAPCSLFIMVLTYYGIDPPGERYCSTEFFGLEPEGDCSKDIYNTSTALIKASIPKMASKFKEIYHLDVITNNNYTKETMPFNDTTTFNKWVKSNIDEGNIIIVIFNDWAGMASAIIGIDDMGTEDTADDVLILADSYDTTDHLQDGYTIWGLERFYHLWQYTYLSFYGDDESLNHGQFLVIKNPNPK